jgi:hypothetical protein
VSETEKVEPLAAFCHDEQWSGWMHYLFGKTTPNEDGSVTIPAWAAERWRRQMATPYSELPESEKESDRVEARRILTFLEGRT